MMETEILPTDWRISSLETLTKVISSGKSKRNKKHGTYPVYGSTGIIGFTEFPEYEGEAILVARVGANAGRINVVSGKYGVTDNTLLIRLSDNCSLSFIWRLLEAKRLNNLVLGSGQPLTTGSQLKSLELKIPEIIEQDLIATVLNDVDELLEGLHKLTAKKYDLKLAVMHQLLTGKKRLLGFSEEWKKNTLGKIGYTYGGLSGKTKSDFGVGNSKYVTFMNLMTNIIIDCNTFDKVKVSSAENQNKVLCGDLLFNGSSETPQELALCSILTEDVSDLFLNSFCFGFRLFDKSKIDGLFLSYYMRGYPGRELIKLLAQGSTRYNISKKAFLKTSVLLPHKNEQVAIAKILLDIDKELIKVKSLVDKTKNIKKALIQELLTGKTRLIKLGKIDA